MRNFETHRDGPPAAAGEPSADEGASATEGPAAWPYASMLIFGYFGADTPAGKRLARETSAALVLIVVAAVLGGVWSMGIPAGVAAIGWSYARYLPQLDELSRSIQLRALAFSYGAAMTLGAAVLAVALAWPDAAIGPAGSFVALVLAEPLRGVALVVLARKYR